MQYGFQSWNSHLPGKYRDLLYGIGAEEFGHVEMLATMIAQLLEKAPVGLVEGAVQDDPTVAAIVGGTDPQQAIVAGAGARPVDSNGNPWSAGYVTASGNLLADFTANANAEMQGRRQQSLWRHQMRGSMGQVGSAGDNAAMESFFSLLQRNVLDRQRWTTREELRIAIVTWIERTYHRRRRQARLARLTPIEFEIIMSQAADQAA